MESAASGLVAGVAMARALRGLSEPDFGGQTLLGALERYTRMKNADYQPMNANFGLLEPLNTRVRGKQARYEALSRRALEQMDDIVTRMEELP